MIQCTNGVGRSEWREAGRADLTAVMRVPGRARSDTRTVTRDLPVELLVAMDGGRTNDGQLSLTSSTRTVIVTVALSC